MAVVDISSEHRSPYLANPDKESSVAMSPSSHGNGSREPSVASGGPVLPPGVPLDSEDEVWRCTMVDSEPLSTQCTQPPGVLPSLLNATSIGNIVEHGAILPFAPDFADPHWLASDQHSSDASARSPATQSPSCDSVAGPRTMTSGLAGFLQARLSQPTCVPDQGPAIEVLDELMQASVAFFEQIQSGAYTRFGLCPSLSSDSGDIV